MILYLFGACGKAVEKRQATSVSYVQDTLVKQNLSGTAELPSIPIYTPVEFALDEEAKPTASQYWYEDGYYYVQVTDDQTQTSRKFESYTFNTDYSTPLLPAPKLPEHEIRIKFYLEKEHPYTLKVYHSSQEKEILTAHIKGTPSTHHGQLHFSKENPNYLVHDDGTPFFGIAHNFSYEGDAASEVMFPFKLEETLRRYLAPGDTNPVNTAGSHVVGNVLSKFKEEGGNFIQLYLEAHTFQIDNSVLGDYRLEEDRLKALDEIFKFCYEHDIYIQLAITDHNDVVEWYNTHYCRTASCDPKTGGNDPNPYKEYVDKNPLLVKGKLAGGSSHTYRFPNTRMMYYVHPDIKRFVKNKCRYIVARYGHYPNLCSFSVFSEQETLGDDDARNFSGEIHNLKRAHDKTPYPIETKDVNDLGLYHYQDYSPKKNTCFWVPPKEKGGEIQFLRNKDIVTNWLFEMSDFIHGLDKSLLVTWGGGVWVHDTLLSQKPWRFDYVSSHVYDRPPSRNSLFANNVLLRSCAYGMPILRGEGGTQSGQANADLSRTNNHNSLWASAFCGSFSTYMEWFWQQCTFNEVGWMYPEVNKPRKHYRPIAAFFATEAMHKYNWIPMGPYYKKHISEWTGFEPYLADADYLEYLKTPGSNPKLFQIDEDFKKPLNWTFKAKTMQYYDPAPPVFGEPCVDYPAEFFVFKNFNFDVHEVRIKGMYPKEDQIRVAVNHNLEHENSMDVEVYALKSKERILGWAHHKESYWLNHEGLSQDARDPQSIVCASPQGAIGDMKNRIFNLSNIEMHIPVLVNSGVYRVQWYSTLGVKPDGSALEVGKPLDIAVQNGMLIVPIPNMRVDNDWRNVKLPDPDYAFKISLVKE